MKKVKLAPSVYGELSLLASTLNDVGEVRLSNVLTVALKKGKVKLFVERNDDLVEIVLRVKLKEYFTSGKGLSKTHLQIVLNAECVDSGWRWDDLHLDAYCTVKYQPNGDFFLNHVLEGKELTRRHNTSFYTQYEDCFARLEFDRLVEWALNQE